MCSKNKWTTGDIWVQGNSNLVAGNIKKGVNIFGITGTYTPLAEKLIGDFCIYLGTDANSGSVSRYNYYAASSITRDNNHLYVGNADNSRILKSRDDYGLGPFGFAIMYNMSKTANMSAETFFGKEYLTSLIGKRIGFTSFTIDDGQVFTASNENHFKTIKGWSRTGGCRTISGTKVYFDYLALLLTQDGNPKRDKVYDDYHFIISGLIDAFWDEDWRAAMVAYDSFIPGTKPSVASRVKATIVIK